MMGARLQAARRARGLTQQAVADHMGLARTTVVSLEKGERGPQPEELIRFASLYGKSVHDLLQPPALSPEFAVQFRASLPADELNSGDVRDAIFSVADGKVSGLNERRFYP